jgi:tRNAThr (cytosine32-N3)-methyltransferase
MASVPAPFLVEEVLQNGDLTSAMKQLTTSDSPALATDSQAIVPPHRSHDPDTNQKRTDPFQFGSRLLQETDNVFEFNAWDHVETDDVYKEYSELQYAKQRESPVSDFEKSKHPVLFLLFKTAVSTS